VGQYSDYASNRRLVGQLRMVDVERGGAASLVTKGREDKAVTVVHKLVQ
jgi:hypothetical protein